MLKRKHLSIFLTLIFLNVLPRANAQYLNYPSSFDANSVQKYSGSYNISNIGGFFNVKNFGAKGDGVTDDTKAIQAAMDANRKGVSTEGKLDYFYPRPKTVYFPKGTYLVSGNLVWIGQAMMLMGQGKGETIIKLKNSAYGFTSSSTPKAVIKTTEGYHEFRNYIRDLTVNVGSGNPGAIGIDFIANNAGGIINVEVKSDDGQGNTGISMTRTYPGPSLLKRISVTGFDYAIKTGKSEYSITFENIILSKQRIAGIENDGNTLMFRKLISTNSVPVIKNLNSNGMVTILDSELKGGSSAQSAIDNVNGSLFARNVQSSGYQAVIKNKGVVVNGTYIKEYVNGTVSKLFASESASLNLPVEETPEYHESDMSKWGELTSPGWYGDNRTWEATINSGKPIIYLKTGTYLAYNRTYSVPTSVRVFNGFGAVINEGSLFALKLVVKSGDENSPPLIIENFGRGITVEHLCKRPVVIKNATSVTYIGSAQAGKLFMEDVVLSKTVTINPQQKVWARQFNSEISTTRILNNGGDLWILGLKTENIGTVIKTTNCGKTELLGGLIYPVKPFPSPEAAFIAEDSRQSLIFGATAYNTSYMYAVQVREKQNGIVKEIKNPGLKKFFMPLHVGSDPGCSNTTITETTRTSTAFRYNAGGPEVNNAIGLFAADSHYSGGTAKSYSNAIANTDNDAMYQSERFASANNANLSYAIPVPSGQYKVILHFAELYHTSTGKRVFDVAIENSKVLDNYDIVNAVGAKAADIKTFTTNVSDGVLNLNFIGLTSEGAVDRPKVSAIEIINTTTLTSEVAAISDDLLAAGSETELNAYPNPFTDKATIEFSLKEGGDYTLVLHDKNGGVVKQISAGKAEAGKNYSFEIGNDNMPAGIYIARLSTDNVNKVFRLSLRK